jgi:hypothetical protein
MGMGITGDTIPFPRGKQNIKLNLIIIKFK